MEEETVFICWVFILVIAVIHKDFQNVWFKTKLSFEAKITFEGGFFGLFFRTSYILIL